MDYVQSKNLNFENLDARAQGLQLRITQNG